MSNPATVPYGTESNDLELLTDSEIADVSGGCPVVPIIVGVIAIIGLLTKKRQ
jgi:hypothetical protein